MKSGFDGRPTSLICLDVDACERDFDSKESVLSNVLALLSTEGDSVTQTVGGMNLRASCKVMDASYKFYAKSGWDAADLNGAIIDAIKEYAPKHGNEYKIHLLDVGS